MECMKSLGLSDAMWKLTCITACQHYVWFANTFDHVPFSPVSRAFARLLPGCAKHDDSSVKWDGGYPKQNQIVGQIVKLWERYGLENKTKFNTRVTSVSKDYQGRWIINNPSNGRFDGVIAAVGTCGDAKMPHLTGSESFQGEMLHSSKLDSTTAKDKKILIIGGGASAVEALEWAVNTGAKKISVLARSEKWIIPRNAVIDTLLAFNIFGQETIFSWIPESILRIFFYRDLNDISPSSGGLFTGTPMVNSQILDEIRKGRAQWLRGDIDKVEETGLLFNHRAKGVPKGGPGHHKLVEGDVIIMATGYKRPTLSFLPEQVFEPPYTPPSWYLQVFPPDVPGILCNNCTYVNAIGTVGNWHIGIYTRLLLMFLVDPLARPNSKWMKVWINMTSTLKSLAPTKAFDFFTYSELIYWFVFVVLINPFRWKWALFVFFGVGDSLPMAIVEKEDRFRNANGHQKNYSEDGLF